MVDADTISQVNIKYKALAPIMNEKMQRHWAATESMALGWGGVSAVSQATGISRTTIQIGIRELQQPPSASAADPMIEMRLRRPGAGRKPLTETDHRLDRDLEQLLDTSTGGLPTSPLRWTSKSSLHLAAELQRQGHQVSERSVNRLLHQLGYSLQSNRKNKEGRQHPDRDAQFKHLQEKVAAFQRRGQAVISVDAKKRELIGDFKQAGREWHPKAEPVEVRVHDFEDKELGHGILERYDRIIDDSGAVVRVHQEDLCQALSVHPDRRYEVDGGPGAEQLGRLIREVAGDRDVARFFDALVYNWLVLSTDGHAKNYSLLLSGHQVRLAPLYDVASAFPYLDHPRKARMAQKIGGEYRPSFIQRRHWERMARSLGLGSDEAHARITALAERLPDALGDAANESHLTVDEQRIADTIRDQISNWAAARVVDQS